ncbi:DMT family transporter [Cohnella caldifontis]|uniref:DMT family transporter n=1 Tax=Cohnella caldifontis TaxID=3027471 RepID=UPI0023ECAB84|nr:DMT family transporter [Cohnella sp. YIM B05605]
MPDSEPHAKERISIRAKGLSLAYFAAVLTPTIIGLSFLFTKLALERADPIDTLMFRFAISFAAFTVPVLLGRVRLRYRGKPLMKIVLLSALYPIAFFTFQAFGLEHASSSEGGIIFALTPFLTMLFASWFLKETTTGWQKASILLSASGVAVLILMKGDGVGTADTAGIVLLLLSVLASAGYGVFARSLRNVYSPAEMSYWMQGVGFAVFLVMSVAQHAAAGNVGRMLAPMADGGFIAAVLYLGVLSSLVSSLASNYAYSKLEASKTGVFTHLSMIVSIAAGVTLLGEEFTVVHVVGSALILAGVIGTNLLGRKRATRRTRRPTVHSIS